MQSVESQPRYWIDMARALADLFFLKEGKLIDKWEQYIGLYEREFARFRNAGQPVDLLEIGVQNGGGLELWNSYLPAGSSFTGLDVAPEVGELVFSSDAVRAYVADATDLSALQNILGARSFDVIIDDGSHTSSDIIASFKLLFGRVKPGGLYIIEDLHASYYSTHEGGFRESHTSIEWLKRLVDAVNFDHLEPGAVEGEDQRLLAEMNRSVAGISFFDSFAVIEKYVVEKNRPFRRLISGRESNVVSTADSLAIQPRDRLDAMLFGNAAAQVLERDLTMRVQSAQLEIERAGAQVAAERERTERAEAKIAELHKSLVVEKTERTKLEARLYDSEAASQAQITNLNTDVNLLRASLRGRDRTIGRLSSDASRVDALMGVGDGLAHLLRAKLREAEAREARAAARNNARNNRLRELVQASRRQAHALREALADERGARLAAERRLGAIEHSRLWRGVAKLRSASGRPALPGQAPAPVTRTDDEVRLAGEVLCSGLFDQAYYAAQNPDLAAQGNDPALHFAQSGWKEGRRPNPGFDPANYLARHPDIAADGMNPLLHFAEYGLDESLAAALDGADDALDGAVPPDLTAEEASEVEAVRATGLFDPAFYASAYPDVVAEGGSLLAHFALVGWRELRDPSASFDTAFYLAQNPDVAESGVNPLLHYAGEGRVEGRAAAPEGRDGEVLRRLPAEGLTPEERAVAEAVLDTGLFDPAWYLSAYPDVAAKGQHPAVHFAVSGWREGRNPSRAFDVPFYLARYGDVAASGENPLIHYAAVGAAEGRAPVPAADPDHGRLDEADRLVREVVETGLFEPGFYRIHNPDVAEKGTDPALHFARDGWREGRKPNPDFDTRFYADTYQDVAKLGLNPLLHFSRDGILEGRRPNAGAMGSVDADADYARWVEAHDTLTDDDRRAIRARLTRLRYQPLISVVMPVYNTDLRLLREAIGSVQAQLYPNWELCIADDASTDARVPALLRELAASDPRIKLVVREQNGHISASSNSALALAEGEFVALMDHDDLIPDHALFAVVASLNDNPDYDLIYSDEDHIDSNGVRHMPYFKSDFNPELLLGQNFVNHLGVYRRSVIEAVGGFRPGFEGSQDYDLVLRVVDAVDPKRILHIPSVLYHWRSSPGGATFSQTFIDRCIASARRAIKDHLTRTGQRGRVVAHPNVESWHRIIRDRPEPAPLVSIIVPTKDKVEVLKPCCDGILHRTDYPNIELIVVDHQSTDPATTSYLAELSCDPRVKIMPYEGTFNYSAINNTAVRQAKGNILAFLNNDIEVIDGDWLDEMVALACLPDVGAVGAKLLYADGRVQHGGVLLGTGGVAGHIHHLLGRDDPSYMGRAVLTSAVSAVTGACLVMRKPVFEEVGGFDERHLAVAFNDIDLCVKIRAAGFRNVFAAQAILYHHESISRGLDTTPEKAARFQREVIFMREKWGEYLAFDPFYNPNLDVGVANFKLAHSPRRLGVWSPRN